MERMWILLPRRMRTTLHAKVGSTAMVGCSTNGFSFFTARYAASACVIEQMGVGNRIRMRAACRVLNRPGGRDSSTHCRPLLCGSKAVASAYVLLRRLEIVPSKAASCIPLPYVAVADCDPIMDTASADAWQLTVHEAINVALSNSEAVRNLGLLDAGSDIDKIRSIITVYDPLAAEAAADAQWGIFDPLWTTTMQWDRITYLLGHRQRHRQSAA